MFALYLFLATGRLSTPGRNFGPSSSAISFADSPLWFSVFIVIYAAITLTMIVGVLAMARLAFRKRPQGQ